MNTLILIVFSVALIFMYEYASFLVVCLERRGDYGSETYQALTLTAIGSAVSSAACWVKIVKNAEAKLKR